MNVSFYGHVRQYHNVKAEIDGIAAAVHRMFPQVDQRFALIVYRDQGDEYVTRTFDFTGSLEEFRSALSQQHASGGGDYPEAVHLALAEAGKLSWRNEGTARVAFLVGDAPPHEEYFRETMDAVSALRHRSVRVYPVGGSGVAEQADQAAPRHAAGGGISGLSHEGPPYGLALKFTSAGIPGFRARSGLAALLEMHQESDQPVTPSSGDGRKGRRNTSTGSPASLISSKLTPFTVLPSLMSRHGIILFFNIDGSDL